ncbi:MAG TPA: L-aspartate oxidase [Anaerohalosphaeraceae bacterium]|nr:L-aspartate oxidase [Phycisphaerae bacterium]HOK94632.1 L-aspartate oxidase [Anaerohalosphaeraceae bacterium]HOM76045.1 L-aspartate oxidase [Anaerohalosphaeraceae bacterium]HPC64205.1 L-aspartate oxidase [Anaerohalosphaeraceae bacterium]HPO68827.1 L-aspartate oxidase [Anaerohalosphaeraceae bacterium]
MPTRQADIRRYLVPINTASTQQLFTDCLVIGAGIAGLRAALEAAPHCNVTLVCKGTFSDTNTWNAQGGIASVLDEVEDSFEAHIEDTLRTGCGLGDKPVIERVVREGPGLVRQLADWGTAFDLVDGEIDISLEGGHSHARIAHSHGDSTGRGIAETLIARVQQSPTINVMEHFFTIDLLTSEDGQCVGVIGRRPSGSLQIIWAGATILATGGAGRLYRETTNPECATADGLAMAWRAGAVLRDMEFMQFHPTTLYIAGASRALVTETLRGEGAILRDINHEPFMKEYDPRGELAPRDVVSRAILDRMLKTQATHVYLDIRHFDKAHFKKRFPLISELCESFDIDVSTDLIPVRPSAHYMIGGLKADISAATSIPRLFACGEAASTGLHGANRLGSNSLLEGLVFGRIAGQSAVELLAKAGTVGYRRMQFDVPPSDRSRLDTDDVRNSLRALMWRNVGITRSATPLQEAMEIIQFWQRYVMDKVFSEPFGWECQNMLTVALLMAHAAYKRQESRGVHYRQDYPNRDDKHFSYHIELARE